MRFDLLKPDMETHVMERQSKQRDHDKHTKAREFKVGDTVMAKNLRPGLDWVKAIIISKLGPLSYLVETENKLLWRRHIDHLKKHVYPRRLRLMCLKVLRLMTLMMK